MFSLRRTRTLYRNAVTYVHLPALQSKKLYKVPIRLYGDKKDKDIRKMVDPKYVADYDEVLQVLHKPKKVIIDVRNREEVYKTGMIPSSINIPLPEVKHVLDSMSNEDFRKMYKRDKPTEDDQIIFYCRSGRRSTEAQDQALKLGYSKSKTYIGSWEEWSSKQK